MQTNSEGHLATIRRFVGEVWNEGHSERIRDYTAEHFLDRAYQPSTAEGHRAMVETLKKVVPDAKWTIDRMTADDHTVVCELTLRGTHRGLFRGIEPKGHPLEVRAYRTFVFEEAKLVEHAALLDTATLLKQMAERMERQ